MNFYGLYYKKLLLIIALPALLGINILHGAFQFDDNINISQGHLSYRIKHMDSWLFFLKEGGYWQRPILSISFAVNYYFGKLNTFGYHLSNFFIHALNGVLIFSLCHRFLVLLPGKIKAGRIMPVFPLLSVLVFLLLPIQTETTAYISSRSSSLVTFFYLLGVFFFLKLLPFKIQNLNPPRLIASFLGLTFCMLMGVASKKTFLTFPGLLLLIYYFHSGFSIYSFLKKHPALMGIIAMIPVILLCIKTYAFYQQYNGDPGFWEVEYSRELELGFVDSRSEFDIKRGIYFLFGLEYREEMDSPFSYLLTEINVITNYYLRKFFFPFELNTEPGISIVKMPGWRTFFPLVTITGIMLMAWRRVGLHSIIPLSATWFFMALAPTSSFIPLYDFAAEHRTYIASPGFAILLGFIFSLALTNKSMVRPFRLINILVLMVFVCFAATVITRNADWRDEVGLWSDTVRKSPGMPRPHHNLGLAYSRKNLFHKAVLEYQKALILSPGAETYLNLAVAYKKMGLLEKAVQTYHLALEYDPTQAFAYFNLGALYGELGDEQSAIDYYKKAISIRPRHPEFYNNLGRIYLDQDRMDEARKCFEKALKIKPFHADSLNNLGALYQKEGDLIKAAEYYEMAIKYDPFFPEIRLNLGNLYLRQGRVDEAEGQFREVIRLDQKSAYAYIGLGAVLMERKLFPEAMEAYRAALKMRPNDPLIIEKLMEIQGGAGN